MAYTVELAKWIDGQGFVYSEIFDHIEEGCTAEEYILAYDPPFRAGENTDIEVRIFSDSDTSEPVSRAWVKGNSDA